jgi:hypothetical protein
MVLQVLQDLPVVLQEQLVRQVLPATLVLLVYKVSKDLLVVLPEQQVL